MSKIDFDAFDRTYMAISSDFVRNVGGIGGKVDSGELATSFAKARKDDNFDVYEKAAIASNVGDEPMTELAKSNYARMAKLMGLPQRGRLQEIRTVLAAARPVNEVQMSAALALCKNEDCRVSEVAMVYLAYQLRHSELTPSAARMAIAAGVQGIEPPPAIGSIDAEEIGQRITLKEGSVSSAHGGSRGVTAFKISKQTLIETFGLMSLPKEYDRCTIGDDVYLFIGDHRSTINKIWLMNGLYTHTHHGVLLVLQDKDGNPTAKID